MSKGQFSKIRNLFGYKMFFFVNIVILIFMTLSFGREFVRSASMRNGIIKLEQERSNLEDKNISLKMYQDYIETETFLEHEAREKFGLQRPGEEQVFVQEGSGELDLNSDDLPSILKKSIVRPSPLQLWSIYFFDPEELSKYE